MDPNSRDDARSVATNEPSENNPEQRRPRPLSLRSWRTRSTGAISRTRSRPRSPDGELRRVFTGGFHDDYGFYSHEGDLAPSSTEEGDKVSDTSSAHRQDLEAGEGDAKEEVESQAEHPDDIDPEHDEAEQDLEKGRPSPVSRQQSMRSTRSQKERDPNMVSWEGPEDPENPRNWKRSRRWAAVLVVSAFSFVSPVSSSMVAPALPAIEASLGIHNEVILQMSLSIFLLAYSVGPLFLGPLSEIYGRVPVLQLANLFFLIFNLVCGFSQTAAQLLVFRFLAGLGGSAPLAIGGGILADCFPPEERGQAIAIYSLAPLIGPAVGPIAGGFIAEYTTWRWSFWAVSIADAVIQVFGLFFLQETWATVLLERKTKKLIKETGNTDLYAESPMKVTGLKKLKLSFIRPFKLLFTQPIIVCLALYMGYLYGLIYIVISSFSALFTSPDYYHESVGISGLNYIALAIGYFVGSQCTSRFNDWLYRRLKRRNGGKGKPEFRIPVMIPCAVLLPIGLFWYGWSAEARIHWIMPDIGAMLLSAGTIAGYQAIQTYVIDSYTVYAASAVACITTLRSLAGFGFPLFTPALYAHLGYGWGNSLLAFVALAIGVPAPAFFWFYGAKLRAKSPFAAG